MLIKKEEVVWTKHSQDKRKEYNLSESRILRVLRHPQRTEEGIAPSTLASMQKAGSKKHSYEIWVMYQILNKKIKQKNKIKIISAWKYPGQSPKGKEIPIPQDILEELTAIHNQ